MPAFKLRRALATTRSTAKAGVAATIACVLSKNVAGPAGSKAKAGINAFLQVTTFVNNPPVWGSPAGTIFNITQGQALDLNDALRFTDPESDDMTFALITGPLPTGVTLDPQTGILTAAGNAPVVLSGNLVVEAEDGIDTFWTLPTLQDERNFYTNIGWTRPNALDETMDFANTPPSLAAIVDVHDTTEGDDLWTWYQQQRRGYSGSHTSAAKVTAWITAWRDYFINSYAPSLFELEDGTPANQDHDHAYAQGLIMKYHLEGDQAALNAALIIADVCVAEYSVGHDGVTPPNPALSQSDYFIWQRAAARWAIIWTYLAEATGLAKWIFWRDSIANHYMGTGVWQEGPTNGLATGMGHYFTPRSFLPYNKNGTTADFDAGRRYNSAFYYALIGEAHWRIFLSTGRADIRARLIKMARFIQQYGHNPANTLAGGPFTGADYGHQAGAYYHREPDSTDAFTFDVATATYDISAVNTLVFGYKLTGDVALLNRAKVHFRAGTRWREGEPQSSNPTGGTPVANSLPLCGATEVYTFVDTLHHISDTTQFNWDKGQLQHCYQLFENGGAPVVI